MIVEANARHVHVLRQARCPASRHRRDVAGRRHVDGLRRRKGTSIEAHVLIADIEGPLRSERVFHARAHGPSPGIDDLVRRVAFDIGITGESEARQSRVVRIDRDLTAHPGDAGLAVDQHASARIGKIAKSSGQCRDLVRGRPAIGADDRDRRLEAGVVALPRQEAAVHLDAGQPFRRHQPVVAKLNSRHEAGRIDVSAEDRREIVGIGKGRRADEAAHVPTEVEALPRRRWRVGRESRHGSEYGQEGRWSEQPLA